MQSTLVVFATLFAVALADLGYNFQYNTNDEGRHQRQESAQGKSVRGSYSYVDPNGNLRTVSYTANENGYYPTGDISVDHETARQAEAQAQLAPKQPAEYNSQQFAAPVPHTQFAAPVPHTQFTAPVSHAQFAAPVPHTQFTAPVSHAQFAAPVPHTQFASQPSYYKQAAAAPQYTYSSQVDHSANAAAAQYSASQPAGQSFTGNVITSSVEHSVPAASVQAVPITSSFSSGQTARRFRSPIQKKRQSHA